MSDPLMEVVRLTNEYRAKHGRKPLRVEAKLMKVARSRAKRLARTRRPSHAGWFATFLRYGFRRGRGAGENIAWGQSGPGEVVNDWIGSENHRLNMLRDFDTIGVGYAKGPHGTRWAQVFGSGRQ